MLATGQGEQHGMAGDGGARRFVDGRGERSPHCRTGIGVVAQLAGDLGTPLRQSRVRRELSPAKARANREVAVLVFSPRMIQNAAGECVNALSVASTLVAFRIVVGMRHHPPISQTNSSDAPPAQR